jgi:hypothetical protein
MSANVTICTHFDEFINKRFTRVPTVPNRIVHRCLTVEMHRIYIDATTRYTSTHLGYDRGPCRVHLVLVAVVALHQKALATGCQHPRGRLVVRIPIADDQIAALSHTDQATLAVVRRPGCNLLKQGSNPALPHAHPLCEDQLAALGHPGHAILVEGGQMS